MNGFWEIESGVKNKIVVGVKVGDGGGVVDGEGEGGGEGEWGR